jgi:Rad52/22 family double-strand break repair protein
MPTKFPEIFAALSAPFHQNDVRERDGQGRNKLSYITARTAMNRLDEVLGPENWQFSLTPWSDSGLIGTLRIRLPDDTIVEKSDVGGRAGMKAQDDDAKSAASDCLKRCAAMVGVARYLYNDGQVQFGNGQPQAPARDASTFTERMVDWCREHGHSHRLSALAVASFQTEPANLTEEQARLIWKILKDAKPVANLQQPPPRKEPPAQMPAVEQQQPGRNANGNPVTFGWPHSGAALFRWLKNIDESFKTEVLNLIKAEFCGSHLEAAKRWDTQIVSWAPEQVNEAALYAAGIVSKLPGYSGEWDAKLPKSAIVLRDEIWLAAAKLGDQLNETPTAEWIAKTVIRYADSLSAQFNGETISDFALCDNQALLAAILEMIQSDLIDSK